MKLYAKHLLLASIFLFTLSSCSDNEPEVTPTEEPKEEVLGCMDSNATNYNPDATKDDGSCTYEVLGCMDPNATNYNPDATKDDGSCIYESETIGDMPSSFQQKVVLEYFTGSWCGACPDGQVSLDAVLEKYPNRAIAAIPHTKDGMMLPEYRAYMKFELDGAFAPGSTVNRTPSPSSNEVYMQRHEFMEATEKILSSSPTNDIGLAIESSITGDELTVTTHAGFLADKTASYKLFVLILEDSVTGTGEEYDQVNYFNDAEGHPYYGLGNPIVGYNHRYVLRAYAHDVDGEAIPSTEVKANNVYVKTNTFNITSYRQKYLSIVAMVVEDKGTPITSPVINAQTVAAGQTKNWD